MRADLAAVLPLVAAAAVSLVFVLVAPSLPVASVPAQDLLAVALSVPFALAALHVSSAAKPSKPVAWGLFIASLVSIATIYFASMSGWLVPVQVFGLLGLARSVGGAIGSRVEHPGHALPACVVAAAADCASVLSPEGVTNQIVKSERALSTFALSTAVPGTDALTFVLGIGDLVVIALLYGIARKFEVPARQVAIAMLVALTAAFAAAAILGAAIPALVPIAIFGALLVPRFRTIRRKDRTTTVVACVVSVGLVGFVALRSLL